MSSQTAAPPQPYELAPPEDPAEDVLRDALEVISREAAVSGGYARRTLRDVLHGEVSGPCRVGKRVTLTYRENPQITNAYFHCWGFKCPRCCPGAITTHLQRTLAAWNGPGELENVHVVVLDEGEWGKRGTRRVKAIRKIYTRRLLRVICEAGGDIIFTPGPVEGGSLVPVGELGRVLAEAILEAPATGSRARWPTKTADGEKAMQPRPENDDEAPREKPRRVDLPREVTPEEANDLYDEALGRPLDWHETKPGESKRSWRKWDARDVTSDEIDFVRERVQDPLAAQAETEEEHRRAAVDLAAKWFARQQ
jgi:hypothetical protein